jgi:NADH:ubiquinone oxidoreductase subunit 5 (subunit L)/multisubunit Na+/H+ antiporter MnhA subunit
MKNSKSGLFFISLTGLTLLAGCAGNTSVFQPASRNAQATNQLILLVFGIAAVVFLVVEGILLFTYFRFSRKSNTTDGLPTQTEGNHRLEIGWTMVPAVILGVVFIFSLRTLQTVSTQPGTINGAAAANTVQVRVTGHRSPYCHGQRTSYSDWRSGENRTPIGGCNPFILGARIGRQDGCHPRHIQHVMDFGR